MTLLFLFKVSAVATGPRPRTITTTQEDEPLQLDLSEGGPGICHYLLVGAVICYHLHRACEANVQALFHALHTGIEMSEGSQKVCVQHSRQLDTQQQA